jgi:hypothetical protein
MPGCGAPVADGATRAPHSVTGATATRVAEQGWCAWVDACATIAPHLAQSHARSGRPDHHPPPNDPTQRFESPHLLLPRGAGPAYPDTFLNTCIGNRRWG